MYFRIKQIKKDVNQLLLAREEKIKKKTASKKEQGKTRTKKLGHMKYPFNSMYLIRLRSSEYTSK